MSLEDRLDGYEVTAVPGPVRLRLSWSPSTHATTERERAAERGDRNVDEDGTLAVLSSYRITRVPVRVAS